MFQHKKEFVRFWNILNNSAISAFYIYDPALLLEKMYPVSMTGNLFDFTAQNIQLSL